MQDFSIFVDVNLQYMKQNIVGIQQVGVGIPDVQGAWEFYRKQFGMDVPIFQESAEAKLMTPYTGGKVHSRSAVLAINLMGGSGLEIWQYTSRPTVPPDFTPMLGDTGVFVCKIKSPDVAEAHKAFSQRSLKGLSPLLTDPMGKPHFFVQDPFGSWFEVVPGNEWFRKGRHLTGGVCGAVLGVSNMDKSCTFYRELLGYDQVVLDESGVFADWAGLPGGEQRYRRVRLRRSVHVGGNFSRLLGSSEIELVQSLDRSPRKIFEKRYWGDLGFIHLCFDVFNMKELEQSFAKHGYPFTVDSQNSFDMGEAAGHFSYIEDPDGTLIEFVETYRIPILKKIGWYLNVARRDRNKPLPDWMLGALSLTRVKD
jgi:catechol 2,3-dioxygenase-like lactoylglutathione lyase family enzyme